MALPRVSKQRPSRNPLQPPSGRPSFDAQHPMSAAIRFSGVALGANFLNLLTGKPGAITLTTTAKVDGAIGAAFTLNSAGSNTDFSGQSTNNDTTFTVGWIWRPTVISNAAVFASDSAGTNGFWVGGSNGGADGRMLLQANNAGTFKQADSNCGYAIGDPLFCAISMNGTTTTNMVQRHLERGTVKSFTTASGLAVTAPDGTYRIGRNNTTHLSLSPVAAIMFAARYHTLQELLQWAADPWAFWYPVR